MSGHPFQVGEQVLLIDRKRRRHLIHLVEGGEFHTLSLIHISEPRDS